MLTVSSANADALDLPHTGYVPTVVATPTSPFRRRCSDDFVYATLSWPFHRYQHISPSDETGSLKVTPGPTSASLYWVYGIKLFVSCFSFLCPGVGQPQQAHCRDPGRAPKSSIRGGIRDGASSCPLCSITVHISMDNGRSGVSCS